MKGLFFRHLPLVLAFGALTVGSMPLSAVKDVDLTQEYNFSQASSYTYDGAAVEVKDGAASLIGSGASSLVNDLIAYWKFDESSWTGASGEVVDHTGNYHGTANNNAQIDTDHGKFGNCGDFDGTNGTRVGLPTGWLDTTSKSFSYWVKYSNPPSGEQPLCFQKDITFLTRTTAGGNLQMWVSGTFFDTGYQLTANVCHNVIITYDSANADHWRVYANGQHKLDVNKALVSGHG